MQNTNIFLKLKGIDGESKDTKHSNWIQLDSFSWGATQPSSSQLGKGISVSGAQIDHVHVRAPVSPASPKLMKACATGEHIDDAKIVFCKAGGDQLEYMTVTLTFVMVTNYRLSAATSSELPMDDFSLAFNKIEIEYAPQDDKGKLGAKVKNSFDVKANKAT